MNPQRRYYLTEKAAHIAAKAALSQKTTVVAYKVKSAIRGGVEYFTVTLIGPWNLEIGVL